MRWLIPVGSEHHKLADLRRRANVLADAWAHIVIANANQTKRLAGILWQAVELDLYRNMVAIHKLVGYRHILLYQAIHLSLYRLLFLATRLVVDDEGHLTLLALDMGIATALAAKHANHQLIEQMLCGMSWRELLLMVLIQYEFTLIHLDIEFIDSYSVCLD